MGENVTGKANVCPGRRVRGNASEPDENPVPLTDRELMVTLPVPVEDNVSVDEFEFPLITSPNARLVALRARFGVTAVVCGTISQMLRLYWSVVGALSPSVIPAPLIAVCALTC